MRRYLLIMILGSILTLVFFLGVNWLVDPYRIFHEPWVRDAYYANDTAMRVEAAGIINTEHFDSIILGTSMAENFSAQEATRIFNSNFVNISSSGAWISERSLVLNYALNKRDLAHVIYSLDWGTLKSTSVAGRPIEPYTYLYDQNPFNDLLIYALHPKIFRYALCRNPVVQSDLLCPQRKDDLETLVEWHSDSQHSKRFGGLKKWLEARDNRQFMGALKEISERIKEIDGSQVTAFDRKTVERANARHKEVLKENLLIHAAKFPNTTFYLFFPPYSRLNFAILKQSTPQRFEEYLGILRLVVQECAKLPNVKVFGFETEDFLDDLANYKDTSHYHQRFNSAMLHWMKNGQHELTPENLEPYIQTITDRAAAYSLREIGGQIDLYLAGSKHLAD